MINGLSYPKFYVYDSTNTTLVETVTLQRFIGNTHGAAQDGEYIVNVSPFSGVRKQTFKGYRINDSIKVFSPERWATILSYQAAVNNDDVEPDTSKVIRLVDYCNAGYTIRYVPHVDLEDIYGYTYSLVHVSISDFGYGLRSHSDQITINVVGVSRDTYWTPFRKFDMVNCVSLDGVNDRATATTFDIGTTHTIEFWVKGYTPSIGLRVFFDSTSSGSLIIPGTPNFSYKAQGSQVNIAYSITPSSLNHFFISRDNTLVTLIINGSLVGTGTLGSNNSFKITEVFSDTTIGAYADGKWGLLRIYQQAYSISNAKIQYAGGYGNAPIDGAAYAIWELDNTGGTSTSETDQSGNGRTLTLINGVSRTTW